ncbi:amino acid ABC transporter permease [Bifidobacterium avesanii]|uniref:ABC transporter permease subunit n=1 Tax=Bifidobacterium avesanii TaxID=1798157 RepID=A0A7K3TJQ3_9BIFI|nr:amino acid ABC transporter permease [Bifidobacterium avesanii]KAB8287264.1 amino acid ABC transporter permease YckA1 [Bifidobacterium avesanii]NEG79348.1 ABC transporter permease subunit [Bifidobacterium avesanii]
MNIVVPVLMGLPLTVLLTAAAFAVGFVLAVPLSLMSTSRNALLRLLSQLIIWLERGVPPLVWLMILYFGVRVGAVRLSSMQAAILGLSVVSMGYLSEILRSGFMAIPAGQYEATRALGLGYWTSYSRVIFPQAIKLMVPSFTTYFIGLMKDSSLASSIGVAEMVFQASKVARRSQVGITPFLVAAVFYIAVSIPIAIVTRRMEGAMREAK